MFRVELTEETQSLYLEPLMTFPMIQLEPGFRRVTREWTQAGLMPTLAFMLERIEDLQFAAEKAWKSLTEMLRAHWWGEFLPIMSPVRPDKPRGPVEECNGGYLLHPAAFDAATDYAVRMAGGLERIANGAEGADFHFIARDFQEGYKRYKQTIGLIAPSREEAKAFLDSLKKLQEPDP